MKKFVVFIVLLVSMISVQFAYGQCTVSLSANPGTNVCQGTSVVLNTTVTGSISNYIWSTGASGPTMTSITETPATTTTYSVTVTGPFGCNATNSITITVVSPGSVTITPSGPTTVCQGNWVLMTASAADSYQWYRNGTLLPGATNNVYSDTLAGSYVCVVNIAPCTGIASNPITVNVNALPDASFTPNIDLTECPGGVTPFVAIATSVDHTYQWYYSINDAGPYTPIPGEINQTFTPTLQGDWFYQLEVVNTTTTCVKRSNY